MTDRTPRPRPRLEGAPLMDPWRDAFVLHLRLADVDGHAIGDALAQVDSHCAESGQVPLEAFGDPERYAADVAAALGPAARVPRGPWWRVALIGAGSTLGAAGVLGGVDGLAHHRRAAVGVGYLLAALLVPLVAVLVMHLLERSVRSGRRIPLSLGMALGLAVCALPPVLLDRPAVELPALAALGLGALALVAAWLPVVRPAAAGRDLVVDPRTGQQPFRAPGRLRWALWGLPFALLVLAAAVVAIG